MPKIVLKQNRTEAVVILLLGETSIVRENIQSNQLLKAA
jgi:hypothetical protein